MTKPKPGKMSKGLVFFVVFACLARLKPCRGQDPAQRQLTINSYATYATSTSVNISNYVGIKALEWARAPRCAFHHDNWNWSSAENYKSSKSWTLSGGEGTKTVYAKFCDAKGNWMKSASSDSMTLDTSNPSKPTVTDSGSSTTSTSGLPLAGAQATLPAG